jgi:hypothetical protein
MPRSRRRRRSPRQQGPTDEWIFYSGLPMTGDPAWDHETLRRAWPRWRRATWGEVTVGCIPWAAEEFDNLRADGCRELWARLFAEEFTADDLEAVLDGVAEDRRRLAGFKHRDPDGARDVHDYLTLLEQHFEHVEALARQAVGAPRQVRVALLAHVYTSRTYGETQP